MTIYSANHAQLTQREKSKRFRCISDAIKTTTVKLTSIGSTTRAGDHLPTTNIVIVAANDAIYVAPRNPPLNGVTCHAHKLLVVSSTKNRPTPATINTIDSI